MKITVIYANKKLPNALALDYELTAKDVAKRAAVAAVLMTLTANPAMAAGADITNRVARASKPIKDLLLGIADPVCYIVFCWGLLEAMLGKGASGLQRMKYAALGYVGLNWLPVFMEILRGAKP